MKLLTRDVDYAIRILMYLAKKQSKKFFDSLEITQKLKIPKPFARKILRILSQNKILDSYKGRDGGFYCTSAIKKVSVIDLIKIFKENTSINECIFKKKLCPDRNKCPLRKEIQNIEKIVNEKFQELTISKLLKQQKEAIR